MARMVQCLRLGTEAEGLDFPPVPGALGQKIFENISKTHFFLFDNLLNYSSLYLLNYLSNSCS